MSYMSLGQMGATLGPPPAPGTAEINSFLNTVVTGIGGRVGVRNECWKMKMPSRDVAKIWMNKYNELKTLYPVAMSRANFSPCTAGNDQGYRPMSMDEWFNSYFASQVVKLDMSPAQNTVAAGTPGSWNVAGAQQSGAIYGYNFADRDVAQTYAQAVVDSGGTATMYQVPFANAPILPPPPQTAAAAIASNPNPYIAAVPYIAPAQYYAPVGTTQTAAMDPSQVYNNPIIPPAVVDVPAPQPVASGMGTVTLLALAAIPVGAYMYFKHR